jgi:hypothetical protein
LARDRRFVVFTFSATAASPITLRSNSGLMRVTIS